MGYLEKPENFNMKDLYLDVSLRTCVDGSSYDFTGRKTFDTTFYRNNIGFGITNISIEINPSLQPIVDITFKDLYGNTIFGTQRGVDNSLDSSVLFNWPPPKFIFSFKGYLGRKVTWMLNLKSTNISYVPSDGSYEVKCSFVPNQWGFLADIPVLYLLAAKKLRYERYGSDQKKIGDCIFKTDSVFSYTRIGKQVESKTQSETKEFELLSKQMSALRFTLSNAVFSAKIISPNQVIKGVVNNIPIKGFTNLKLNITDKEFDKLKEQAFDSSNTSKLNTYLQLKVTQGEPQNPLDNAADTKIADSYTYDEIDQNGNGKNVDLTKEKAKLNNIIDTNLKLIDNEIKKRVYLSTKKEIGKLTIGEVFQQISRDSAFILGAILDAGFEGYANFKDVRDNGVKIKKEIIGKHFPLFLTDKGEEIPAMEPLDTSKGSGPNEDYGVKDKEMKFVENFIKAIGEGISENLISDEIAANTNTKIKNRINNLEALQPNPYKPFFTNISENILIRSGIMGFITRSNDPSRPGDYHQLASWDRDSVEKIQELAKKDLENVTKDILVQLSYEDKTDLIRFCTFFTKLLSDDGNDFLMPTNSNVNKGYLKTVLSTSEVQKMSSGIWNYPIAMKDIKDETVHNDLISVSTGTTLNLLSGAQKALGILTLKELLKGMIKTPPVMPSGTNPNSTTPDPTSVLPEDNMPDFYNTSTIDAERLTASMVKNNGIYYSLPNASKNSYSFVFFDNPTDVIELTDVPVDNKPEDGDLDGGNLLNRTFNGSTNEPVGFVPINSPVDSDEKTLGRINILNLAIKNDDGRNVIDYKKCKNYYGDTKSYLHDSTETIQTSNDLKEGEIEAKNIAYAVYAHTADEDDFKDCVFGPFIKSDRGRNQRAAIKVLCRGILDKLDEIEAEKNEILSSVLGKANEHRDSIYKQMHTIFHQWQIIASSISGKDFCTGVSLKAGEEGNFWEKLENEYGSCANHVEKHDGTGELGGGTTIFVYDYPLGPVNGEKINVKKSIINIEALYKPNGTTTVLNIIQQICTKNNFVFVPFPGDANSDNIKDIYTPHPFQTGDNIRNYFHVLFTPTPETRSKLSNDDESKPTDYMNEASNIKNSAIGISFGSVYNQIVKNINVSTDSTKPTAESILNLQRLVDKENTSKKVSMDCSMLSVYEGRSYKATVEMIGNAQVYPMQYFYIQNMPMFGGLYQVMKVSHSITPNDMSTTLEGIRMRFSANNGGAYGGVKPITIDELEGLGTLEQPLAGKVIGSTSTFERVAIPIEESLSNEIVTNIQSEFGMVPVTIFDAKNVPVTSVFFRDTNYYYWKKGALHGGNDYGLASGTKLKAFFNGTVTRSEVSGGYGGVIVIEGTLKNAVGKEVKVKAYYAHCRKRLVVKGQTVSIGQVIAESGGNKNDPDHGSSTGSHLHFEFFINNVRVEPLFYLKINGLKLPPQRKSAQTMLEKEASIISKRGNFNGIKNIEEI